MFDIVFLEVELSSSETFSVKTKRTNRAGTKVGVYEGKVLEK